MSDNQRLLAAVSLCVMIYIGWQLLATMTRPPAPPPEEAVAEEMLEPSGPTGAIADAPAGEGENGAGDTGEAQPATSGVESGAGTGDEPGEPVATVRVVPAETRDFETDLVIGRMTNRHAALTRFELKKYRERPSVDPEAATADRQVNLVSARENDEPYQARVVFEVKGGESAADVPQLAFESASDELIALRGENEALTTAVTLRPRSDAYGIDYAISATNHSGTSLEVGAHILFALPVPQGESGGMFAPPMNEVNGICFTDGSTDRNGPRDFEDGEPPYSPPMGSVWAGIDRQYFVVAAIPTDVADSTASGPAPANVGCTIYAKDGTLTVKYELAAEAVAPGARWTRDLRMFLGPKRDDDLAAVSAHFRDVIDYNIWGLPLEAVSRPMVWLLNIFHGWTGSWGLAIIILTLMVKALLFPVTYKSAVSMRRMQLLKPEIDKLKERFKDDPQRVQMEQMKLFKEKDVSLFGGCLPMLLQMPVWLALYRALWTAVDLYQQPFLWLSDLTAPEPGFPSLAIGFGALMYLQQLLAPMSPSTGNDAQAMQMKIMRYGMPAFMVFIFYSLPSGLVFYVCVNSVFSIAQQFVINRRTKTL